MADTERIALAIIAVIFKPDVNLNFAYDSILPQKRGFTETIFCA